MADVDAILELQKLTIETLRSGLASMKEVMDARLGGLEVRIDGLRESLNNHVHSQERREKFLQNLFLAAFGALLLPVIVLLVGVAKFYWPK